jgi:uncharacterized protein YbgA (DUF1722 family)/uncharacterized protein YbbK (DUF523 family)
VRFDGGHKRDAFLVETFGRYVEWVPVCPEVDIGLGTPRESIRLVRDPAGIRLVGPRSGNDLTAHMLRYARRRVRELADMDLDGYVLKKDSPTCGLFRVRVYGREREPPTRDGRGLFAEELTRRVPELPVEEEGRLSDPRLREGWVERVFVYSRLKSLFSGRWTAGELVSFHTAHKLQLLAHSPEHYRRLGPLVAHAKHVARADVVAQYSQGLMDGFRLLATTRKNTNVLQHAAGHLKRRIGDASRAELAELIEDYRRGLVPLIVPVTLLRHHVRRTGNDYLAGQTYLEPHPRELMLRNHV